ncbi:unnamed protein product [Merluccius merluccius]
MRSPSGITPEQHEDPSRKFPWDEPDFDPQKVVARLDGRSYHRQQRSREDQEDRRRFFNKNDVDAPGFHGNQRRLYPDELGHRTPPHFSDEPSYGECRGVSPNQPHHWHDGRVKAGRGREDFRDDPGGRSRDSPQWLARERLSSGSRSREPSAGWKREGQGRSQERPRDHSPRAPDRQGTGEERRDKHNSHVERRKEDSYRDRSPISNQHRRDMEHPGYKKEEELRDRDGYGEALEDVHGSKPLVVDHGHGIASNRGPPGWDMTVSGRQDMEHHSRPRQMGLQPDREESRETPFQDGRRGPGHESRRGPMGNNGTNQSGKFSVQECQGHFRGGPHPARGRMDFGRRGANHDRKLAASPMPSLLEDIPQERQEFPRQERQEFPRQERQEFPRQGQGRQQFPPGHKVFNQGRQGQAYRDQREDDCHAEPRQEDPGWGKDLKPLMGRGFMSGGMSRPLDPVAPSRWKNQQESSEVMVVAEETLTIKVDMNRPVSKNSALCYSSDRQLSLDLVNVGRQRLDFLPMMKHSGTYRENTMHSGTFAQEVITLVHQVKEQYFRGNTISLNERFSAPQDGGLCEGLEDEMVPEDQRPTLNKRFTMTMNTLPVHEPVFAPLEPRRDPDDLRNNLERRRQERTEAVKITIAGGSQSHGGPGPASEPAAMFEDYDGFEEQEEDEGFPSWPERQSNQPQGPRNLRFQRRGGAAPRRPNVGPRGQNGRFGNRLGPPQR